MSYKKGLVAFIDILGTEESSFDDLLKINEIFHKELSRVGNNDMFCRKLVTSFSDCAYIIYAIEENSGFDYIFYDSLSDLSISVCAILANGFLCRGGICYGEYHFEENKKYLFGAAINEAYKLESEKSMPRIIINDLLGEEIYKKEKKIIKNNFQKLIRKDEADDRYYLNYLYPFSSNDYSDFDEGLYTDKISIGEKDYIFDEYYNTLINISKNNINENKTDHNIIAKHRWQINYLMRHKKEREHGPFFSRPFSRVAVEKK